ncbi:hypothetical protein IHE49_11705 [Rhodanobacter sp. 7MK24]|uniref:hypothetical protein n=1 Tax=Rhodanobacter sp. 7MK24 TaxID=2775922 RepID=UPI00177D1482|nr:hypothetical protein [Rhodanobacter sp. 7MK24]
MRTILLRLIGILEVAGGCYGMILMLYRLLPFRASDSVVALIGLALYAFVLVAGVLLLENDERGVRYSSWAQLLQLPLIATPVFTYALHCGGYVNVFATLHLPPHLGLTSHFASQGFVLAVGGPAAAHLGINLLALLSWLALKLR